jgi:hypothetical protein
MAARGVERMTCRDTCTRALQYVGANASEKFEAAITEIEGKANAALSSRMSRLHATQSRCTQILQSLLQLKTSNGVTIRDLRQQLNQVSGHRFCVCAFL